MSAAALAYEVLLMRLLSIVHWHHFAYMIISLALLGYGASGTFIALARARLLRHFEPAFALAAGGFALLAPAAFLLAQRLPFNALEIVWDARQLAWLGALYLVFFVPFFLAATAIGLALAHYRAAASRVYLYDLLGAGAGALAIVAALFVIDPLQALGVPAMLGLAAAAVPASGAWRRAIAAGAVCALLVFALSPGGWFTLRLSPYKGLSQALAVVDARVLAERSSPLGLLTVVSSPTVPFRHAPGLSFNAPAGPGEQLAVFTDGDAMSAITRNDATAPDLAWLDYLTAAAPYHLLQTPRVLVLGAGGGQDVLLARALGARAVDAVELNPQMAALVTGDYGAFAGHPFSSPGVRLHIGEARAFVARSGARYDLIQMALLDSAAAASAGVHALSESYVYTVEAFSDYLARLEPGGLLAITRWLKLPPRDSLKLFATALEALRRAGVSEPGRRLAMLRGWNTVTLLVANGDFTPGALTALREFCAARSFDLAYYPGMRPEEANRYNVLAAPILFQGATALLGEHPQRFLARYKFALAPASDDRPYFFHFFKWSSLGELIDLRERGGAGLLEWGYLVVVITLAQALAAGTVLIVLPLLVLRRSAFAQTGPVRGLRGGAYFFLLGLAFLFVEIAFIQKLVLFLGHPLFAVVVVLSGFLVFAGLGSGAAPRLAGAVRTPVRLAVAAISGLCVVYVLATPVLAGLVGLATPLKVALALGLIAPLAFAMGMPFPLGLARVPGVLVPWAWGLNGFASVLSAALATLLAIEFGFSALVLAGAALYAGAGLLCPRAVDADQGGAASPA